MKTERIKNYARQLVEEQTKAYSAATAKLSAIEDNDIAIERATDELDAEYMRDDCNPAMLLAIADHWVNYHQEEL